MTLNEIREALKDRRPSIVAKATGLHRNTIAQIRDGRHVIGVKPATLLKLTEYLRGNP